MLEADVQLDVFREDRAALGKRLKEVVEAADEPGVVAEIVLEAASAPSPKLRYAAGAFAHSLRLLRRFALADLKDTGI